MMKIRGDEMYRHLYPRHLWRPYASHSNWAWHFLGEIGIAFAGEVEGAKDWVWFAANVFFNVYPVWSDDDGGNWTVKYRGAEGGCIADIAIDPSAPNNIYVGLPDKTFFLSKDTGASFTNISRQTAKDLGATIDENTPFLPIVTASDVILSPLVTLRSVRVGKAEVENVDVLVHNLPGDTPGLLGNSFLNKFRVTLDSFSGKMILFPQEGKPSPDRPGGYGKEYWVGRFRFYHNILEELKKMSLEETISLWKSPRKPIYTKDSTRIVHSLHYDWTGWLSDDRTFPANARCASTKTSLGSGLTEP